MWSPRVTSGALAAGLVIAGGCVGKPSSDDPPDAPGMVGVDAARGDALSIDAPAQLTCRDKVTVGLDNGRHNPGQNCLQGCHNHGFYLAGTIYSSAAGGTPVVGASLTFIDATGFTGHMVSALNGNFWSSLEVVFPVRIIASSCPDIQPMNAMVNAAGAGCNQNGCHGATGGAGRIHLP